MHALAAAGGATLAQARLRVNTYALVIEPSTAAAGERGCIAKSVGDSPYAESIFFGAPYSGTPAHNKAAGGFAKAAALLAGPIGKMMAEKIAEDAALRPTGGKARKPGELIEAAGAILCKVNA
jgi:hypothetical protein